MKNSHNYLDTDLVDERFRDRVEDFNKYRTIGGMRSAPELKRETDACAKLWDVLLEEGWNQAVNKDSQFIHEDYPGIVLIVEPWDVHAEYIPLNIHVMPDSQDHDTRWPASWVNVTDSFIDADIFRIPRKKAVV